MRVSVRRFEVALMAFLLCGVLAGGRAHAGECATQPPPAGLAEGCLSRTFRFTETMGPDIRHAVLTVGLSEWMEGCFPGQSGLIYASDEGEASVEHVYELIKDLPGSVPSARVLASYTPRTYTEAGRTCYGVESVTFSVKGAQGTVDLDGEIEIIPGSPSALVKEAATAAKKALREQPVRGSAALSRFLSVLEALETQGKDLDDTWYNVQPIIVRPIGGDLGLRSFVPAACFTEYSAATSAYVCRPADEALHACERHLSEQIVDAYSFGKTPQKRFADVLEAIAGDIQRSVDYLHLFTELEAPTNVTPCTVIPVFMDRIAKLAHQRSVYMVGGY